MQRNPDRGGGARMKAQARKANVSRGAGSSQSTSLRLVNSNNQVMSLLTRIVALMHFLVCPGLGTGTWNSKNQNMHIHPRNRDVGWRQGTVLVV